MQQDADAMRRAVEALRRGEAIGLPTETVYGLAANAWDEAACRRIFAIKGRPATNPLIVHVADRSRLGEGAEIPASGPVRERLEQVADLWPGPLTLILPKGQNVPSIVTAGRPTVAIRIPAHPVALELLACLPFPLAAPSANRSTAVSPTSAADVREELGDRIDVILDGGPCRYGLESTIVSLVDPDGPLLLRHGALSAEFLANRWRMPLSLLLRSGAIRPSSEGHAPPSDVPAAKSGVVGAAAPGQMRLHYAPRTPVWLADDPRLPSERRGRWGRIRFREATSSGGMPVDADRTYAETRVLSHDGDPVEIAASLYATLRELDHRMLEGIVVDTCAEAGIGRAVMDRLRRASANHGAS
jgi:L-threonylcarbamoyladenylate synthase